MEFPLSNGDTAWFALTVRSRHEKAVADGLDRKGVVSYLPLYNAVRHWSDRKKIVPMCLFAGYVFCRLGYRSRMDVLGHPGVTSIVGFGDAPTPVPDAEIEAVRAILASGRPASPWPFLKTGQRVRIVIGALKGVEGALVRAKDAWRVVVRVELLQRAVAVEIGRDMIEPL